MAKLTEKQKAERYDRQREYHMMAQIRKSLRVKKFMELVRQGKAVDVTEEEVRALLKK